MTDLEDLEYNPIFDLLPHYGTTLVIASALFALSFYFYLG